MIPSHGFPLRQCSQVHDCCQVQLHVSYVKNTHYLHTFNIIVGMSRQFQVSSVFFFFNQKLKKKKKTHMKLDLKTTVLPETLSLFTSSLMAVRQQESL